MWYFRRLNKELHYEIIIRIPYQEEKDYGIIKIKCVNSSILMGEIILRHGEVLGESIGESPFSRVYRLIPSKILSGECYYLIW